MSSAPALSLIGVSKFFSGTKVLNSIDLTVEEGEFISLLGPSGCGKTTTLNLVAGFEEPDQGDVCIAGQKVNGVPPFRRELGMVFQGHALFPHMTCFENVAFGLAMRQLDEAAIRRRVGEALELVRLTGFDQRFPRQLSGGQQQRVGLARALVVKPRLLLLDEPLSNLDARLRKAMQTELRTIHKTVGATMIYVTHDQEEALTLSDRIAVMNGGRIEQLDVPEAIYCRPRTRFVADFIGASNFLAGKIVERRSGEARVDIEDVGSIVVTDNGAAQLGETVTLGIRCDRVTLEQALGSVDGAAKLQGRVIDKAFAGAVTHVRIDIGPNESIVAHLSNPSNWILPGAEVLVSAHQGDWMMLS